MFLLHGSIKRIQSKTTEKKWRHHFPHYKSMRVFVRCSRAANSILGGPIWPQFKLIHNIMHVLLPASLKRIRSISTEIKWWLQFFRCSNAANSLVRGGIWPKSKLIQAFTYVLITCKYEKEPIKNSEKTWWRCFPHYKSMGFFSDAQGQLTP